MSVATAAPLSYPLDGGRRLVLRNPRSQDGRLVADAAICDRNLDEPLYEAPVALAPADVLGALAFTTGLGAALGERHPELVGQSGQLLTALLNWAADPAATLAGTVAPPLLPKQGDVDTEPLAGVWYEVRDVRAEQGDLLHGTIARLEDGNPRAQAAIVFGNAQAERHAAERIGLDRHSLPELRERVVASFYGPDGVLPPLSTVDTPPGQCPDKDRLIAEFREQLAERDRRLAAIHELMTCAGMTPIERVIAYGVANEAASAHSRKDEDAPRAGMIINQSAIATNVNVSRQAVGTALKRWDEQGYLGKESRHTGQKTKAGAPIFETIVVMPAKTSADLITIASTWVRSKDAKHVGGNGERSCPECGGTKCKRTARTVTVRTTTIVCATLGCNHVYEETAKEIKGTASTFMDEFDWAPDISTMIDITKYRTPQTAPLSTVDTPPCRETDSPETVPSDNAGTPPPPADVFRPVWGPVACTDCPAEGRAPAGETWTCLLCQRKRRGVPEPFAAGGDVAAGGGK